MEEVFTQLALYHELATTHVVVNALFTTLILQCGFSSSTPALFSINAFASLPSVREKSNPEIPVPIKFHELPVIIRFEKEKVDGL
jgi:hypothetical protein